MTHDGSAAAQLTAENLFNDPYPVYARLRRESPVQHFAPTGEFLVTRWKECFTVGTKDSIFVPSDSSRRPEARVMGLPNILSLSGPPHAALRKGIDANLTAPAVAKYAEGLVRPIARQYVESLRAPFGVQPPQSRIRTLGCLVHDSLALFGGLNHMPHRIGVRAS